MVSANQVGHRPRRHQRRRPSLAAWLIVWLSIASSLLACDPPSKGVDGGELHGVFEHDARADGSTSTAAPSGSATRRTELPDGGGVERLPELRRQPLPGPCATTAGAKPREPPKARPGERAAKRPGCRGSRILEWQDEEHNPRYACVTGPRRIDERAPLPLILFFHGEHDTPRAVGRRTKLRKRNEKFDLSGDPKHRGFIVLAVQGRRLQGKLQFATVPASRDNVDVKTIDHFLGVLESERLVDRRRIYTLGDSEGAQMAQLYAYLRPDRVAAVALYAGFADHIEWSCSEPAPPTMMIYRACDSVTPCATVEAWLERQRSDRQPVVGLRLGASKATEPACMLTRRCKGKSGRSNHQRWPKLREPDLLDFLARYQLEVAR